MLRTTKSIFVTILITGVFLLGLIPLASFGTTDAPTTASIAVSVFQDDGKTPITTFTSGVISVRNSAFETLDQSIDYTLSINGGIYTIANLPCGDTYYVTFAMPQVAEKVTAIATTKISNTPKAVRMIWSSNNNYTAAKSGIIQGLMVDDSGAVLAGATVKAYNNDTIYETTSVAVTGAYKLYAPAGSYTFVTEGKDVLTTSPTAIYPYFGVTTDYANTAQAIKVVAGQAVGPMADLNGKKPWSSMEYDSKLGLSGITISPSSNTITGTANKNTIVSVYNSWVNPVDIGNGQFVAPVMRILVASSKVTAKSATDKTGNFSIKLPYYAAGKRLVVAVTDSANNYYEDASYNTTAVGNMTASLTADSKATIVTPVTLAITEPKGVTAGNYNSCLKSVSVTTGNSTILLNSTQYSNATKGKIIINKGVLGDAQTYTVTTTATGYDDISITQTVGVSTITPPTNITGTFTLKAGGGSVLGTAQFTSIGTAGSDNTLVYLVSNQSTTQVKLGNPLTGYTSLSANTDITGVSTTNKYIHVYEIDGSNKVVKAKVITLATTQVKGTGTVATSGTITATATALKSKTGSATITLSKAISGLTTSDIVVKKDGDKMTLGSDYDISGVNTDTLTITFTGETTLDYTYLITVWITKTNFTVNNTQGVTIPNELGKPVGINNNGLYFADGSTTIEFTGEAFQTPPGAECYTIKRDGTVLVNNTDYTISNYTIQFLAHAALVPTSVITLEVKLFGYSFTGGLPITIHNGIQYIITATSNGISSATGTTTISMSAPIQGLAAQNISVAIFGEGGALDPSTYTLSGLTGSSFTITFLQSAGLVKGSDDILVAISKSGYNVNDGQATVVKNNLP